MKIPTDPVPLRFGPGRFAKETAPGKLVVFSATGAPIVTFSEYEAFWEEPDGFGPPEASFLHDR